MAQLPLLIDSRHPVYSLYDYTKFRLSYLGGRQFVEAYLQRFSLREDCDDFKRRLEITHNPGYAAEAIDEIRNGIAQRMNEIIRTGCTKSYDRAVSGKDGGVDLEGSTMNNFIVKKVLPELLSMGRVGIYVDMPKIAEGNTLADFAITPHPYVYTYRLEDILNWSFQYLDNEMVYTSVLLRETYWKFNEWGLPDTQAQRYRLVRRVPTDQGGGVLIELYEEGVAPNNSGQRMQNIVDQIYLPKLNRIPFAMVDIGKSLLCDIADIQVGLLQLASSDLTYAINSNFPIYIEGYDPHTESLSAKTGAGKTFDDDGKEIDAVEATGSEDDGALTVGTMHGRRFPIGAPAPAFINPSDKPLTVSMAKQESLKDDIRRLLNLALKNVQPSHQSAASKQMDQSGLESGLSSIGFEIQQAEAAVARIWAMYEDQKPENINIAYPTTYSLKSDQQRITEATALSAVVGASPSRTHAKEVCKQISRRILEGRVPQEVMSRITAEIDAAKYITSDMDKLIEAVDTGICDAETASEAAGFDPAIVVKAQKERIDRLAQTAIAQSKGSGAISPARGNPDAAGDASDEKDVSQNPDKNLPGEKKTRGNAK